MDYEAVQRAAIWCESRRVNNPLRRPDNERQIYFQEFSNNQRVTCASYINTRGTDHDDTYYVSSGYESKDEPIIPRWRQNHQDLVNIDYYADEPSRIQSLCPVYRCEYIGPDLRRWRWRRVGRCLYCCGAVPIVLIITALRDLFDLLLDTLMMIDWDRLETMVRTWSEQSSSSSEADSEPRTQL
ncbi:hypothetical protein BJY01DRAFT_249103 [Aspergillus pseudoustus]|uniref:Ig-like domain-containing protein n=1 Tax=Aspergillus pseudoustus TaxID=1810923 RepID=A0ABR4JQV3_9EURO